MANKTAKLINQLALDGTLIKQWPSAYQAGIGLGGRNKIGNIISCANGNLPQAFGFKWEYAQYENLTNAEYNALMGEEENKKIQAAIGDGYTGC